MVLWKCHSSYTRRKKTGLCLRLIAILEWTQQNMPRNCAFTNNYSLIYITHQTHIQGSWATVSSLRVSRWLWFSWRGRCLCPARLQRISDQKQQLTSLASPPSYLNFPYYRFCATAMHMHDHHVKWCKGPFAHQKLCCIRSTYADTRAKDITDCALCVSLLR